MITRAGLSNCSLNQTKFCFLQGLARIPDLLGHRHELIGMCERSSNAVSGMSGRVAPAKTIGEPTYSADVLMCHREWAT
jgi:hypothetical protein